MSRTIRKKNARFQAREHALPNLLPGSLTHVGWRSRDARTRPPRVGGRQARLPHVYAVQHRPGDGNDRPSRGPLLPGSRTGWYPITVEGDGKRPYTIHPKHYDIGKDKIRIRTRRDVVGKSHGPFTLRQTEPWLDAVLLGLLKSAYLMVFSLLGATGYRYAQGEAVTSIREQLLSPEKELFRPLVAFTDTANTEHAVLLWTEYQCWAVKIRTDLVILPPGGSIDRYRRLAEALEPPLTLGSTVQWTAPKFGGSPIHRKKSDALKTKHLFGASFPNPRQDYVVVYEEADMVAALPVSGP